jgi:hypothetical protein
LKFYQKEVHGKLNHSINTTLSPLSPFKITN